MPEDEADLADFLAHLPTAIPVVVIGLGSNLIVRDGGVPGVVVRLGRGFGEVKVEDGWRIRAGTAAPDVKVSRAAQEAASAGLAFFRGIPAAGVGAMHCNFLINLGSATAADIETLGETVRRRVKENSGVELEWEIKRIGVA